MMGDVVDQIVECMASNNGMSNIQRIQTEHRVKLAQFWGIKQGSRILEIGCGQGDTTAVLAQFVGETGFVHGVDIASPNYGGPITVGDSAKILMNSRLGKRIKMEFEIDILSPDIEFSEDSYDTVVFSHCSWYLKSFDEFAALLRKVRKWGRQLAFAEWDARIQTLEQLPHLLAVLIQAQYECFKRDSESNVRTLLTPYDILRIAQDAGWVITAEQAICSPDLQDGEWEYHQVVTEYETQLQSVQGMPDKLKSLIRSEVNLLKTTAKNIAMRPMSTYAFVAR